MCLLSRNGNSIREISIPFPTYQSASPFTLRGSLPPDVYIIFPSFSRAILISKKFDVDRRQNRREISTGFRLRHSSEPNRFRSMSANRRHRCLITWQRRNISRVTKLNRNQSYSRETRGDRSDCSLRKTRTTNSRETNASRVSNSQVESHYSLLLLLLR